MMDRMNDSAFEFSLSELHRIDQLIYAQEHFAPEVPRGEDFYDVMIVRTLDDNSEQFSLAMHNAELVDKYKGKEILKLYSSKIGRQYRFACIADEKTMIYSGSPKAIEASLDTGLKGPETARWYKNWQTIGDKSVSFAIEHEAIATMNLPELLQMTNAKDRESFDNIEHISFAITLQKALKLSLVISYPTPANAKNAEGFIKQTIETMENVVVAQEESIVGSIGPETFAAITDLFRSIVVKSAGRNIDVTASANLNFQTIGQTFERNYKAANRSESANKLRQTALAFHNFESANGSFPSPVMVHESGKRYSWRIAILPYIGEQELYNQYRFDEDWDSANNAKITAKMPDFFRGPEDPKDSTTTNWMMLSGPGGMFDGELSLPIAGIRDGTSNTIMAVESKSSVHWAKPEDITIDPKTGIPQLGGVHEGGFHAAFGDGSVRFISDKTPPEVLWKLFTASGGEVFNQYDLDGKGK